MLKPITVAETLQYYNKEQPGSPMDEGQTAFRYSSLVATIDSSLTVEIIRPSAELTSGLNPTLGARGLRRR